MPLPNNGMSVPVQAVIGGFRQAVTDVGTILRDLFGIKLSRNEEPGWLGIDNPGFSNLAVGAANQQALMSLDATYDFVAAGVYQVSNVQGDVRAFDRPFLWDVQLGSSDRHLANSPQHSDALGGRHMNGPLWFSKLAHIARQSRIVWNLTNLSADAITVYLFFIGYRIYDVTQLDLT
ncbi:MAG: hypothetical protein ABIH23_32540 [bacterium]